MEKSSLPRRSAHQCGRLHWTESVFVPNGFTAQNPLHTSADILFRANECSDKFAVSVIRYQWHVWDGNGLCKVKTPIAIYFAKVYSVSQHFLGLTHTSPQNRSVSEVPLSVKVHSCRLLGLYEGLEVGAGQ
jgi:hypothetical protein